MARLGAPLLVPLLLLGAGRLGAQELAPEPVPFPLREQRDPSPPAPRYRLQGDLWELRESEGLGIAAGNVRLETDEFTIFADEAVAVGRGGEARELRAAWAGGDIILLFGPHFFSGEALFLDLEEGRLVLERGWLSASAPGPRGFPLGLRADLVVVHFRRIPGEGGKLEPLLDDIHAGDCSFSTCRYGRPHYRFDARRLRLLGLRDALFEDVTARVGELPVFKLRRAELDLAWSQFLPTIRLGRSSEMGKFVRARWDVLRLAGQGDERPWEKRERRLAGRPAPAHTARPLGLRRFRLNGDTDYLEKRGTGAGALVKYGGSAAGTYGGRLEGYYIKDRGEDLRSIHPDERRRNRVRWLHEQRFDEHWSSYLEYAEARDRGFLPEYFEKEVKADKPPEASVYLKRVEEHEAFTGYTRIRRNRFETVDEELPRLRHAWAARSLLQGGPLPLQLSHDLMVDQIRRNHDQDANLRTTRFLDGHAEFQVPQRPAVDRRLQRLDAQETLTTAFGPPQARISPLVGGRFTSWSETQAKSDNIERASAFGGARYDTSLWRPFELAPARDGAPRRWRHVLAPQVDYLTSFHTNVDPALLVPFDEVETVARSQQVGGLLFNRVQYARGGAVRNLVEWRVKGQYFPDAHRDNPDPKEPDQAFGPIRGDLRLQPTGRWSVFERDEYIVHEQRMEVVGVGTTYTLGNSSVTYSNSYQRGVSSASALQFNWQLSGKWDAGVIGQYDFRTDEALSQEFLLQRRLHRWIFQIKLKRDIGRELNEVSFVFGLPEFLGQSDRARVLGTAAD